MKLSTIKKITESVTDLYIAAQNARAERDYISPNDPAAARKYGLAKARFQKALRTVEDYSPIFKVTLGQFDECLQEVFTALGYDAKLSCYNFKPLNNGQMAADLTLDFVEYGDKNTCKLGKIYLENENQPLAEAKLDLLRMGLVKGFQRDLIARFCDALDVVSWNTITKTQLQEAENQKIAKAIRAEEREAKRLLREKQVAEDEGASNA